MIREAHLIAQLLLTSPTPQEWNEAIKEHNILQKGSPATAKRTAEAIRRRIGPLGTEFQQLFLCGSDEMCSQLMLAAVVINSPILGDFMRNEIVDAKRMYRDQLEANDWCSFWLQRKKIFPELSKITENSSYKIQKMAFKCLADASYIQSTRIKKLQNVYLLPEVKYFLQNSGRTDIIRTLELEA
jgi:hypothetical protein